MRKTDFKLRYFKLMLFCLLTSLSRLDAASGSFMAGLLSANCRQRVKSALEKWRNPSAKFCELQASTLPNKIISIYFVRENSIVFSVKEQ